MKRFLTGAVCLFLSMAVSLAEAQQSVPLPTPEQTIQQVLPPTADRPNGASTKSTSEIVFQRSRLSAPIEFENDLVLISDVRLNCVNCGPDGEPYIPSSVLRDILVEKNLLGRPIPLREAFTILTIINEAYADEGFVFVNALAEEQSLDPNGHLFLITIVESRLGDTKFSFDEAETVPKVASALRAIAKAHSNNVDSEEPLRIDHLQRLLLLMNDVPGVTKATGTPQGRGTGQVDLFVDIGFDRLKGFFFADTNQSPVLGPWIGGISLSGSSLILPGDQLTGSLINTAGDDLTDFEERNTVQVLYQVPIGGHGTTVNLRGLYSLSKPGNILEPLDLTSDQYIIEAGIEHPFIRTRDLSVWSRLGFEYNEGITETIGGSVVLSEDSIRIGSLGVRWEYTPPPFAYLLGDFELRKGIGFFGASEEGDNNLSRADGDPEGLSVRASIEGEYFLPIDTSFTRDRLSLFSRTSGQYAFDPLLGVEEFAYSGRGYDPAEISGDHGLSTTLELRHRTRWPSIPLPEVLGGERLPITSIVYAFGDYGYTENLDDGLPEDESLESYGIGLRLQFKENTEMTLELAKPRQDLARTLENDPQVLFGLVHRF